MPRSFHSPDSPAPAHVSYSVWTSVLKNMKCVCLVAVSMRSNLSRVSSFFRGKYFWWLRSILASHACPFFDPHSFRYETQGTSRRCPANSYIQGDEMQKHPTFSGGMHTLARFVLCFRTSDQGTNRGSERTAQQHTTSMEPPTQIVGVVG